MSTIDERIQGVLLSQLAVSPGGDPTMYATPGSAHRPRLEAMATDGKVRIDPDGTVHLTTAGWYALDQHRLDRVWYLAVTEHAQRQGPADSRTVRRLVLEQTSTEAAFRKLSAAGQIAAALTQWDEAVLLKARLAVLCGVPVHLMDEEAVLLRAEELAQQLQTEEATSATVALPLPPDRMVRLLES